MSALEGLAFPTVEFLGSACMKLFLYATLLPIFKCQHYKYEGKIGTDLVKQLWANNFIFPLKSELHYSKVYLGAYYFCDCCLICS